MLCLQAAHQRMDYLLDCYIFLPEDIELNRKVLTWPKNINPIFEQNDEVRIYCSDVRYVVALTFIADTSVLFCIYSECRYAAYHFQMQKTPTF